MPPFPNPRCPPVSPASRPVGSLTNAPCTVSTLSGPLKTRWLEPPATAGGAGAASPVSFSTPFAPTEESPSWMSNRASVSGEHAEQSRAPAVTARVWVPDVPPRTSTPVFPALVTTVYVPATVTHATELGSGTPFVQFPASPHSPFTGLAQLVVQLAACAGVARELP